MNSFKSMDQLDSFFNSMIQGSFSEYPASFIESTSVLALNGKQQQKLK